MENTSSSPSVSPTKPDSNSVDAINHLVQGKRHLLVRDYASAVSSLQEACKLLAEKYGETANECGEAYFYYGKALLELSRMENGVLGNALQGVPDDDGSEEEEEEKDSDDSAVENPDTVTEEEREKIREEVGAAIEENARMLAEKLALRDVDRGDDKNAVVVGGGGGDVEDDDDDDVETKKQDDDDDESKTIDDNDVADEDSESKEESEDKEEDKSEDIEEDSEKEDAKANNAAVKAENEAGGSSAEPGPSKSGNGEEKEEEEISNLELAWEILELAKIIFKRQSQGNRELQLKTTDVLMKLGEVSIESDNYAQAIDDLLECLNMRLELLSKDDRLIADVYYQLGLAYSLSNLFDKAVDHFNKAIDVIQLRIDNHKKLIEGKPLEGTFLTEDDPIEKARREISELEDIIPDIRSKIEDTQDLKRNEQLALKEAAMERLHGGQCSADSSTLDSGSSKQSPSKPVTNITHLVKRKRQPEDGDITQQPKKTRGPEEGDKPNGEVKVEEKMEPKSGEVVGDTPCMPAVPEQS